MYGLTIGLIIKRKKSCKGSDKMKKRTACKAFCNGLCEVFSV